MKRFIGCIIAVLVAMSVSSAPAFALAKKGGSPKSGANKQSHSNNGGQKASKPSFKKSSGKRSN